MAADVSTSCHQTGHETNPVDRTWFGQRTKRTEAMPKNTLFGGELEIYKENDKEQIKKLDIEQYQKEIEKQRQAKQTRYHSKLPAYLRKREDDKSLEESKETVTNQLREHAQAKKLLDVLETNSKFFNVGVRDSYERTPSEMGKAHQWFKQSDLKHSDDINIIGLEDSKTRNFNRDRYGRKPESHQYSLNGDPLRKGMDFGEDTQARSAYAGSSLRFTRARDPSWLPREAYMKKKSDQKPILPNLPFDLPPNIQHAFGTSICTQVLSDPVKVNHTIKEQEMIKANFYKTRSGDGKRFVLPSERTDPVYEDLSHSVRQNMFPGYTFNHTKSLNKTVYTEDVFKNRQKDPDQWRYHRDELSTWAEYNVIRDRLTKEWDKYNQDKPKIEANWDRTAKRPAPPPPKPVEKTKPTKVANKQKKKPTAKDNGFDDVVFKTPPVTPPPGPPPQKIMPKQEVKKDDEFWEFYNKG